MKRTQGLLFVVSAPSGAGKTSLCRAITDSLEDLTHSISYATRKPRPGETDGRDYYFVSQERFQEMIKAGDFAEWAEVHGNLYGTSFEALEAELARGGDVLLDIDVQGALQIADKVPGAVLVFVLPPSWEELRRRLETRGLDAPDVIDRRVANARGEVAYAPRYQYLVANENLDRALEELASIVRAERCRTERRMELVERLE